MSILLILLIKPSFRNFLDTLLIFRSVLAIIWKVKATAGVDKIGLGLVTEEAVRLQADRVYR